jgi:hypothetical protein
MDVEELCGEAALALVGPVERNGRLTALCRKGIHIGREQLRPQGIINNTYFS